MIDGIDVDVVVVGAGPVGLLTAIELKLGGARVLVLERLAAPGTAMKAMGFGPLADEALRRRGMGAAISAEEARAMASMRQLASQAGIDLRSRSDKFSGHFGGLLIHSVAPRIEPRLGSDAPGQQRRARMVGQPALESMLAERAQALGIEVRRECDVTGLRQRPDGVDLEWTSPAGPATMRCGYLVACDGGRSQLRKLAGFGFPGTAPTSTFYQVSAEIDHPERLLPAGWQRTERGVFSYGPLPGRLFMLDFSGPPASRDTAVTRDDIETLLRHISGQDVRVTRLLSASRWGDNTRLADTYRLGRVLLAGDAAHVHSPFGGQGLSLGLADAANLGWKLAAVVRGNLRGDLAATVLDTYTAERRPAAQAVLANTLAQSALLRPDPQSGALRDLLASLMPFDDVSRHIGAMTSGLATRYDLGSSRDDVGRLAADQRLGQGNMTLYDVMQNGGGVFIDATGAAAAGALLATAARIRRVVVDQGPSLLIRPDACVAWAGDGGDVGGLKEALDRWFV